MRNKKAIKNIKKYKFDFKECDFSEARKEAYSVLYDYYEKKKTPLVLIKSCWEDTYKKWINKHSWKAISYGGGMNCGKICIKCGLIEDVNI